MIARRLFLKMMGLAPFAALAGKAVEAQAEERSSTNRGTGMGCGAPGGVIIPQYLSI